MTHKLRFLEIMTHSVRFPRHVFFGYVHNAGEPRGMGLSTERVGRAILQS
jgi:hypothetical protein